MLDLERQQGARSVSKDWSCTAAPQLLASLSLPFSSLPPPSIKTLRKEGEEGESCIHLYNKPQ